MSDVKVEAPADGELTATKETGAPEPNARATIPADLLPWTHVLKPTRQENTGDDGQENSLLAVDMERSSVSPRQIARLADFVSQLGTSLVRIWYSHRALLGVDMQVWMSYTREIVVVLACRRTASDQQARGCSGMRS
jgi:hypothetical protein